MKQLGMVALGLALSMTQGCSWIEPLPGAGQVKQLSVEAVAGCKKLGHTHTSALDHVGPFERDPKAVTENLLQLAKNEAVRMGGDSVVAREPLKDGQMVFDIYLCRPR